MARFIKVENIVVNVDLICAVTERFVRERIPTQSIIKMCIYSNGM